MEEEKGESVRAFMPKSLYSCRPGDGPLDMCRCSYLGGFYLLVCLKYCYEETTFMFLADALLPQCLHEGLKATDSSVSLELNYNMQ